MVACVARGNQPIHGSTTPKPPQQKTSKVIHRFLFIKNLDEFIHKKMNPTEKNKSFLRPSFLFAFATLPAPRKKHKTNQNFPKNLRFYRAFRFSPKPFFRDPGSGTGCWRVVETCRRPTPWRVLFEKNRVLEVVEKCEKPGFFVKDPCLIWLCLDADFFVGFRLFFWKLKWKHDLFSKFIFLGEATTHKLQSKNGIIST